MPLDKSDEDTTLPKATVDKLIHDLTPEGYSISKETRAALKDAAQLFLNTVALEANRICDVEKKKTINQAHIYKSLGAYGFENFVSICNIAAADYEDYSKHKPSKQDKFKESGKTMEELEEFQMRLFRQAKEDADREFGIDGNRGEDNQ